LFQPPRMNGAGKNVGNMQIMLDTNQLATAEKDLGQSVEQLITPLTCFKRVRETEHFAIDNGAFSCFSPSRFRALLSREYDHRRLCRFVAVPDVVGDARRTLEVFECWRHEMKEWPLALVMQDGQEHLPIPWNQISAIFVGGSTAWKLGASAAACVKAAKALGKWVHIGRVNTPARYEYFQGIGADSIDGSGLARYQEMRHKLKSHMQQPKLFLEAAAVAPRD